jgi:ATP-dependent Lon protease
MTGEISLRGLVLPVGGIKEKILAAKRAGISCVLLPQLNRKDLEEIPAATRESLQFEFLETVDQALSLALEGIQADTVENRNASQPSTATGRLAA